MWNRVKFLNDDLVVVARDSGELLIGRFGTTLMVVCADCRQVDVDRPLILLAEEAGSREEAIVRHLTLTGLICKESKDSEYFKRPCMVDNMQDLDFTIHRKMDYIKWAEEALKVYREKK